MFSEKLLDELSEAEKYVLMLLYAKKRGVKGSLWFQKEMFELSKSFEELAEELDFSAYSYGPWSESLLEVKDMLENSGLIVQREDRMLVLTKEGEEIARTLWCRADEKTRALIIETKSFLEDLEWDELLLYIYVTSPGMADKSVKYRDVISRRIDIALKMFLKGKVSMEMAAKLAGLPVIEFRKLAIAKGAKPFIASESDLRE
ncbi:MAG: hypothetical protein DRP00_04630 [Candidatus Aenigmatarchaeota archaeon]|nr:MAG: hypothetical protein DRP00_04630 [Candidatus Aenigmarchaeota archaeon]